MCMGSRVWLRRMRVFAAAKCWASCSSDPESFHRKVVAHAMTFEAAPTHPNFPDLPDLPVKNLQGPTGELNREIGEVREREGGLAPETSPSLVRRHSTLGPPTLNFPDLPDLP